MLRDYCGVVGIAANKDVASMLFYSLRMLQHRGQESAGIAVVDGEMHLHRDMGRVHEVFDEDILASLKGEQGIGHVRYSTTGGSSPENSQPITVSSSEGSIALAHNGDIINSQSIRDKYQTKGWAFTTSADSEIIIRLLAKHLNETGDMIRSIKNVTRQLKGSYSLAILHKDTIYAVRDPHGIRPLILGKCSSGYIVASESVGIDILDGDIIRDVKPGEILEITKDGYTSHSNDPASSPAHCMFEWVYFARADSIVDTRLVYDARIKIGQMLARGDKTEADVVVPVPDSGRAHGIGYAQSSGIPYAEGLMKNRYVDRTFIMPQQRTRVSSVRVKLNPVRSIIEGKRIILVDDSIVRGTTMKQILKLLYRFGAEEIHLRIGSPPITDPCYFGVDIKNREQFIANRRSVEEIREELQATSLRYTTVSELVEAIGLPHNKLCLGCVTGEYPLTIPGEKTRFQAKLDSFRQE